MGIGATVVKIIGKGLLKQTSKNNFRILCDGNQRNCCDYEADSRVSIITKGFTLFILKSLH